VDDPELTARGAYRFRPLVRVLIDWRGRVPASARVFRTLAAGPVIMATTRPALAGRPGHFEALARQGVTVDAYDDRDLPGLLANLGRRSVVSLLVEGGPRLQRAFAEADLIDRVQVVRTSHLLGTGVPAALLEVAEAGEWRPLGHDFLMERDVHGTG
jgi:diaminohydroxyphosphoribosylaminopyrimidine deaminase / 5-amino-6-(5-phosphoribosylamino)uracil reductase